MPAALVTGAASGIGKATAERLRADGFDVLGVRPRETADDLSTATREGNRLAVDAALERFGRLDVVVANAGIQHVSPVAEFPEDRWDAILAILLTSPFLLAKYAWEALAAVARGASSRWPPPTRSSPRRTRPRTSPPRRRARPGEDARAGRQLQATAVCPGYVRTPLVEAQLPDQAKRTG